MLYTSDTSVFSIAKAYHDGGLNVIPLRCDGSKSPTIKFRQYLHTTCPWWRIEGQFANDGKPVGIGIICGETSGNLLVIDWEGRAIGEYDKWFRQVSHIVQFLPVVRTPSGGRHIYLRSEEAIGGTPIAYNEKGDLLVETRGQGQYVVGPGSPVSIHRLKQPYRILWGNLLHPPVLTTSKVSKLLEAAKTLNRYEKPEAELKATALPLGENRGSLPGDVFNQKAQWEDILRPHGWSIESVSNDTTYWSRPGVSHKSATTGYGQDVLYVFSTSAHPFQAGHSYNKFACYALLNCDGDFSQAAREVANG